MYRISLSTVDTCAMSFNGNVIERAKKARTKNSSIARLLAKHTVEHCHATILLGFWLLGGSMEMHIIQSEH